MDSSPFISSIELTQSSSYSISAPEIPWNSAYIRNDDKILAGATLNMGSQARGARYQNILPVIQSLRISKSWQAPTIYKFIVTLPLNVHICSLSMTRQSEYQLNVEA